MRILQVTSTYHPEHQFGGPPQKIHALSRGLVARGHQVHVITWHSARPHAQEQVVVDGVTVQYLPWAGRGAWRWPTTLSPLTEQVGWAQVVHGYGLYNLLVPAAACLARRPPRPFLLEPLGMYVPRVRRLRAKRLYHYLFTTWMSRQAACVIATSPAEKAELADLVDPERLALRPNGLDLAPFRRLPPRARFREQYGIAPHEQLILFLGRISPIKNLVMLLHAFHDAHLPQARLALVGPLLEPDYAHQLRALVTDLGLQKQVLFTGPLYNDDKLAALAAADLFVLPSLSESYGNAAAEAVAAGLPVLLTEGCGLAPLIRDQAGLVVPPETAALADGLRLLLTDPQRRAALTNGRHHLLAHLSWEGGPLQQSETLYHAVINAAP